jgi:hypothetical protein
MDIAIPYSWVIAKPGERVIDPRNSYEVTATATNDYLIQDGDLFRRFGWMSHGVCEQPYSSKGEYQLVPHRWDEKMPAGAVLTVRGRAA